MTPSRTELAQVRGVIFDVDGVLLDARPSYHAAAEEAARRTLADIFDDAKAREVPFDRAREVPAFKAAGGFNDDWDMSRGILLLMLLRVLDGRSAPSLQEFLDGAHGQGLFELLGKHHNALAERLPPGKSHFLTSPHLTRVCCALYAGDRCRSLFGFDAAEVLAPAPAQGLWTLETPLAKPATLRAIVNRFPVALFTGRNPGEAALALERLSLEVPEELRWVADGRPKKPDGTGLVALVKSLHAARMLSLDPGPPAPALFLGDTRDDRAAADHAKSGAPLVYAHIETFSDTERVLTDLLAATA